MGQLPEGGGFERDVARLLSAAAEARKRLLSSAMTGSLLHARHLRRQPRHAGVLDSDEQGHGDALPSMSRCAALNLLSMSCRIGFESRLRLVSERVLSVRAVERRLLRFLMCSQTRWSRLASVGIAQLASFGVRCELGL